MSEQALVVITNYQQRINELTSTHEEREEARGLDPTVIIGFINTLAPLLGQLFTLCKKTPPPTPDVPKSLADQGVSQKHYEKAFQANWGAKESYNPRKDEYNPHAIKKSARAIAERDGTKVKLAKPSAVAGFKTAHKESVDDIALTIAHAESQ